MRGYMYAYGYRNLEAAHDTVASLKLAGDPCGDCSTCPVRCAPHFDVRDRVSDIARLGACPAISSRERERLAAARA